MPETERGLNGRGLRPEVNPYIDSHRDWEVVIPADEAPSYKGRWPAAFGDRSAPLHLEVGSGNGFFLAGMAGKHPEQNWLGVEIRYKRVVLCAKKIQAVGLKNARIARYDAWRLSDLFHPGDLAGLYVNHPDPWPKERHAKHRLLGPHFCAWASEALTPGARLRLKTDFLGNVELLEASVAGTALRVIGRSDDASGAGPPWPKEDDVITNYQQKFIRRGLPVYALELVRD